MRSTGARAGRPAGSDARPETKSTVIAASSPGTESVAVSPSPRRAPRGGAARPRGRRGGRGPHSRAGRAGSRAGSDPRTGRARRGRCREGAELSRHGARRHAGSSRDLVGAELASVCKDVEHRDRSLCCANSTGGRLTGASHRGRFVADSGTALLRVQLASDVVSCSSCPYCGPRPVDEYAYFGEVTTRPSGSPSLRELTEYVYFRDNVAGVQREWWQHRAGCGEWFLAERDTRTNEVLEVMPARSRRGPREAGPRSGERIDRSKALSFTFAGWKVTGFEGDTIASAAFAAGKRVFSRSLQVPPPARPPLLLGSLRELPDDRRRRPEHPRLHRADPRGRGCRGAERALARSTSTSCP